MDKEINGAVYTPRFIREFIVERAIKDHEKNGLEAISNLIIADIACGCGGFFSTITTLFREKFSKSYYDIFAQNIFGLDIQEYSIVRTKILLCLMAILNGEDKEVFQFNLFCGDALNFKWDTIESVASRGGFDIIVGNPPYVGVTKMNDTTRLLMKSWSVSLTGKPDLYIPFFQIGLENLNDTGVLGYITVNTFFKSLNGRLLRKYFSSNEIALSLVDFGNEQIFRKRSTYTCICVASKVRSAGIRFFKTASKDLNKVTESDFSWIRYCDLDDIDGWHMIDNNHVDIISRIEKTGIPLNDKFLIRNGFATLKNDIYLFTPSRETEQYYVFEEDGKEVLIEKNICRNAIKPNTLKSESEIDEKIEKLIFPYILGTQAEDLFGKGSQILTILDENAFKNNYPMAYKYLKLHKDTLSKRDRGNKEYEKWYAFGRNQALTIKGYKLLFPYISNRPCFVLSEDEDLLFYNGYAVISNSLIELKILQKILMSNIFWYYIKHTSKPYSGNFFSIAKNYIKNFSICELTEKESLKLLSLSDTKKIDKFLAKKYKISL